eukprot:5590965-Pleurochrysis_carterae.AAC.1
MSDGAHVCVCACACACACRKRPSQVVKKHKGCLGENFAVRMTKQEQFQYIAVQYTTRSKLRPTLPIRARAQSTRPTRCSAAPAPSPLRRRFEKERSTLSREKKHSDPKRCVGRCLLYTSDAADDTPC